MQGSAVCKGSLLEMCDAEHSFKENAQCGTGQCFKADGLFDTVQGSVLGKPTGVV